MAVPFARILYHGDDPNQGMSVAMDWGRKEGAGPAISTRKAPLARNHSGPLATSESPGSTRRAEPDGANRPGAKEVPKAESVAGQCQSPTLGVR